MAINAKKLLAKIPEKAPRGRVNLYLDKSVYLRFKEACEKRQVSKVLEQLMLEFIASAHPVKRR